MLQTFWRTYCITLLFSLDTLSPSEFRSKYLPWSLIAIHYVLVVAKLILRLSFVSSALLSSPLSITHFPWHILLSSALSSVPVKGASTLDEPSITLHLFSESPLWSSTYIIFCCIINSEFLNVEDGLRWWLSGNEAACQCRRREFDSWVGKIPWRRKLQPAPVFLPGESHRQRSLVGYSPWSRERVGHNLVTEQQQWQM